MLHVRIPVAPRLPALPPSAASRRAVAWVRVLAMVAAAACAAGAAAAQPPPPGAPAAADPGLAAIQASLAEIATTLRTLADRQEANLLLGRLDVAVRRVAPLEATLQRTRDSRDAVAEQILRLESSWEMAREEAEERDRLGETEAADDLRRMNEQFDAERKLLQRQLAGLDSEIQIREADLAQERERILTLEDAVDRLLGLR